MPDGNFAVLSRFDFIEMPAFLLPSTGCSPFKCEQCWDNDIALVKVNQSTGAVLYTLDAGRSVAIDAWNVMATSPGCGEIYISANTFNPSANPPDGQILASVIRVDDQSGSFVKRWRKDMLGKHWQLCTFGICRTSDGGGLIKCQHPLSSTASHFLNCRRSIWYAPVSNSVAPPFEFTNTNFVCDQPMVDVNFVDTDGNGRIGPAFMVGSWNRDNLKFTTCSFKSTGAYPETYQGHGAENFDARMTFTGCTFQQLYKGVYAQYGAGVTDPTTLTNCTFTQVRHGGHIVGGALHTATGNTFANIPVNLFNDASYGLRFEGSTNLTVSETNTFSSTNSGTCGVLIKDCYGNASEVTRNTFTNVDFGVQTEQNNTGLQIRCNGYTGNDRAWSINPATPANTPGLFSDQGFCGTGSNQAGNLFNDPDCPSPGVAESHIRAKVNFSYRARSGAGYNANEIPTCVSNGPIGTNGIVVLDFCGPNSNINACAPPCTNCSAAQAMMAAATNEPQPWTQQAMFNQAINLYLKEGDVPSALQVAKAHFQEDANFYLGILVNAGEYETAQSKLAAISTNENLKRVASLYQVLVDLGKSGKSILGLNASQEAKLSEVANSASPAKYAAQNILTFAKGYVFVRPVEVWTNGNLQAEAGDRSTDKAISESAANNWLSLLPNPTNGAVEVRWNPSEGAGTLEVFNMGGTLLMQQQVALQNGANQLSFDRQPAGAYLVRRWQRDPQTHHRITLLLFIALYRSPLRYRAYSVMPCKSLFCAVQYALLLLPC